MSGGAKIIDGLNEAISDVRFGTFHGRDWAEDTAYENGNYNCRCSTCGEIFVGYKRRVTCRVCASGGNEK